MEGTTTARRESLEFRVGSTTSDYQLGPFRAGQRPSLVPEAWR